MWMQPRNWMQAIHIIDWRGLDDNFLTDGLTLSGEVEWSASRKPVGTLFFTWKIDGGSGARVRFFFFFDSLK